MSFITRFSEERLHIKNVWCKAAYSGKRTLDSEQDWSKGSSTWLVPLKVIIVTKIGHDIQSENRKDLPLSSQKR